MRLPLVLVLAMLWAPAAPVHADRAGVFDYYLLAMSWTPGWCAIEGDGRADARCDDGSGWGWSLHGLWPQYSAGWPEYCETSMPEPTRRQTRAMADIMGSAGLALHQWRKHGRCTGLDAQAYFDHAREATARLRLPDALSGGAGRLRAAEVAAEFAEANDGLEAGMVSVICRQDRLVEVRLCMTRDLDWRRCGDDVRARMCSGVIGVDSLR